MRLQSVASLALFLTCQASISAAKNLLHDSRALYRSRHESLEDVVRREALDFMDAKLHVREELVPRATSTASAPTASGIPTDLEDSKNQAAIAMACTSVLSNITTVTNEAGMAACYNILFLNNETGVFEADLRLYQISQPSGKFAGIQSSDFHPQANYPDATSTTVNSKMKRDDGAATQSNNAVMELQQYTLVGQVHKSLTLTKITQSDVMALLIPSIAVSATSPTTKQIVMANITSASTVYFVTGVFAGQSAEGATAAKPSVEAAAAAAAAPFALPGTTFGIFPTGGILTWTWTVLFVGTFAFGTIGRIMSRKQNKSQNQAKKSNKDKPEVVPEVQKIEMVDIDISYHKTFGGDRPNYYVERLPSTKR